MSPKYGSMGRAKGSRRFNFVTVLLLVLAVAIVYAAIRYIPPYWTQWRVKASIAEVASKAYHERREDLLREEVLERLRGYGIEPAESDVEFEWGAEQLIIRVKYHIDVKHPFVEDPHRLDFNPEVVGDLKPVSW